MDAAAQNAFDTGKRGVIVPLESPLAKQKFTFLVLMHFLEPSWEGDVQMSREFFLSDQFIVIVILFAGAGVGLILTYATYMTRKNSVVKMGTLIPICNNLIR